MQASLQQYNDRIDEIYNNYTNGVDYMQLSSITDDIMELTAMQAYIHDTLEKLKKTKQILSSKYQSAKTNALQNALNIYNENLQINENVFQHTDDIIEVDSIQDIPITPIYWIRSVKQYGVNIGGMILRGNIGNIYNSNIINRVNSIHNLTYCKNENSCSKLLSGKICKYYHDPQQLLQLQDCGIDLSNYYKPRNFINTSWIYTEYPEKKQNANMRHFGSRDSLKHFIQLSKIEDTARTKLYIKNYKDQCMHDILVLYALYTNEL